MQTGNQVMMFNHRFYKLQPNGGIELGAICYPNVEFVFNKTMLLHKLLATLPSHIATLYSTRLLKRTLPTASEFRGTLHLYAMPVLMAAVAGTLMFSDYVLCLYHDTFKTDGAWSVSEDVVHGLAKFLQKLKPLLPADLYSIAETGFFSVYFHNHCTLRQQIGHNPRLKSEEQIRELLASV